MRKENTILIFGASGFIGISLVKQLLKSGYKTVYIADIKPPQEQVEGVVYLPCDITSEELIQEVFETSKPSGASGNFSNFIDSFGASVSFPVLSQ